MRFDGTIRNLYVIRVFYLMWIDTNNILPLNNICEELLKEKYHALSRGKQQNSYDFSLANSFRKVN